MTYYSSLFFFLLPFHFSKVVGLHISYKSYSWVKLETEIFTDFWVVNLQSTCHHMHIKTFYWWIWQCWEIFCHLYLNKVWYSDNMWVCYIFHFKGYQSNVLTFSQACNALGLYCVPLYDTLGTQLHALCLWNYEYECKMNYHLIIKWIRFYASYKLIIESSTSKDGLSYLTFI